MNQLMQINVDQLLAFAQHYENNIGHISYDSVISSENDELLEIFHAYNTQDFYTKAPKLYATTTKCCATGTCASPVLH
jgi:hypothetical protein